ncbi:hypothetical protein BBF96_07135 [Anoxybacter fermentans]|uniref:Uncharacterized protein n=1 Tax=Anoxybacter fermentans TaxID=1323375 RepID=A0A3Q9HQ88_9FIRM|nr:hypothetical protein BBF96_07135 [Anoxybacter fermentans]
MGSFNVRFRFYQRMIKLQKANFERNRNFSLNHLGEIEKNGLITGCDELIKLLKLNFRWFEKFLLKRKISFL